MTENSVHSEPRNARPSATPAAGATTAPTRSARSLLRQPRGFAAVIYLALLVLAGLLASMHRALPAGPAGPADVLRALGQPPARHRHPGRDVLSRLLYGIIPSLQNSLIALVVFLVLGIPVGIIAGYRGGGSTPSSAE